MSDDSRDIPLDRVLVSVLGAAVDDRSRSGLLSAVVTETRVEPTAATASPVPGLTGAGLAQVIPFPRRSLDDGPWDDGPWDDGTFDPPSAA